MTEYDWEPRYGFTEANPVVLASALEVVRRRMCAYGADAIICDCKYGLGHSMTGTDEQARWPRGNSEMTGCPELRAVIRLLLHPEEPA